MTRPASGPARGRPWLPGMAVAIGVALLPMPGALAGQDAPSPEVREISIPGVDVAVELVRLPGGTFSMGSPEAEAGRDPDEGPVHVVELSPFWMTVHEVTVDQYAPFRFENFDDDTGPEGPGSFDVDAVSRPSPPYEDPGHGLGSGGRIVGMEHGNSRPGAEGERAVIQAYRAVDPH